MNKNKEAYPLVSKAQMETPLSEDALEHRAIKAVAKRLEKTNPAKSIKLSRKAIELLEFIKQCNKPPTYDEIEGGLGWSRGTISKYSSELITAGLAQKSKAGGLQASEQKSN